MRLASILVRILRVVSMSVMGLMLVRSPSQSVFLGIIMTRACLHSAGMLASWMHWLRSFFS